MSRRERIRTARGRDAFNAYYTELYGEDWAAITRAFEAEPMYETLTDGLVKPYHLDVSSAAAARCVPLPSGARVLDLCAAPGGKCLVLATRIDRDGQIVANELSAGRRARLHRVLDEHLPESLRARIRISAHDGRKWGLFEKDAYDVVIADVPCSSERHVYNSEKHLAEWSANRPITLARQAGAFLAAALDACKPGGHVLYCTCALSTDENDGVIERASRRRVFMSVAPGIPAGRPTRFGELVRPDLAGGAGPLFVALLKKPLSSES
ncbi:MAG: RsmB/NOP family class I SAM-dependent RNA methyltransferase [Spirochaetaceae bacterium]|nr:MAG: RsmB/NOP family class I SAM-dependent RNA methyltransferase [Spirochaetaceae bacterium]